MKNIAPITLAMALATIPTGASAQGESMGTIANVTLALTRYSSAPSLVARDEYGVAFKPTVYTDYNWYTVESASKIVTTEEEGTKLVTTKLSNKDFLLMLVDEGVIDSITGWSIVNLDAYDGGMTMYIKKLNEMIDVSYYLSVMSEHEDEMPSTYSWKSVDTENLASEIWTSVETESESGKGVASVSLWDGMLKLQGMAAFSGSLKTYGKGEDQYQLWLSGTVTVSGLSGVEPATEDSDSSAYTGTCTLAAAKPIDVSTLSFDDPVIDPVL